MRKNIIITFIFVAFFMFVSGGININASESVATYNEELGYSYSNSNTAFRIWSSSASEIEVVVEGSINKTQALTKDQNTNVWLGFVGGDLSGCEYTYTIKYEDGTVYENVLDPYGKYLNGTQTKNMVFSDTLSAFEGWYNMTKPLDIKDKNKIIYGINVDTFSVSSSWNGNETYRGKLYSLSTPSTIYNNVVTGFDHVKNLGVTYVELSNVSDLKNPFAVSNNYVTGEYGYSGSLEMKTVVNAYYLSNIGVILSFDCVNFSSDLADNFHKIDKEYFSSNATLDINLTMVKKYIKDIVLHWAKEYKLSGVKLENMASLDVALVNELSSKLLEINENMIIYGDGSYSELNNIKAGENNLGQLENTKMLNGAFNYAMLGDVTTKEGTGILSGNFSEELIETLKFTLLSSANNGQVNYELVKGISYKNFWGNETSYELINYFGTKQGLSIYDKLFINNLSGSKLIEQKIVLGFGTLMVSGGIPYIEAGSEFLASYQNFDDTNDSVCTLENSLCFYSEADKKIVDWSFAYRNESIVNAFRSLVNFRKSDTTYIQDKTNVIKNTVKMFVGESGNIGYERTYPNAYVNDVQTVIVLFNYSNNLYNIDSFGGEGWQKSYQYNQASKDEKGIMMPASSIYMASKTRPPKVNQWVMLIIVLGVIGLLYSFNIFMNKKLVENRGYDIGDINKKYRPFINKNKIKDSDKKDESNEEKNDNEDKKE